MGHSDRRTLLCDDVIRALSVPEGGVEAPSLDAHLASCPTCASWADGHVAFQNAWDATRPVEPSSLAWDSVWSKINTGLDQASTSPAVLPISGSGSWMSRRSVAMIVAQAAAVLLVATLWVSKPGTVVPSADESRGPAFSIVAKVEIPEGQHVLIRQDGSLDPIEIAQGDRIDSVDSAYAFLGELETMAAN